MNKFEKGQQNVIKNLRNNIGKDADLRVNNYQEKLNCYIGEYSRMRSPINKKQLAENFYFTNEVIATLIVDLNVTLEKNNQDGVVSGLLATAVIKAVEEGVRKEVRNNNQPGYGVYWDANIYEGISLIQTSAIRGKLSYLTPYDMMALGEIFAIDGDIEYAIELASYCFKQAKSLCKDEESIHRITEMEDFLNKQFKPMCGLCKKVVSPLMALAQKISNEYNHKIDNTTDDGDMSDNR